MDLLLRRTAEQCIANMSGQELEACNGVVTVRGTAFDLAQHPNYHVRRKLWYKTGRPNMWGADTLEKVAPGTMKRLRFAAGLLADFFTVVSRDAEESDTDFSVADLMEFYNAAHTQYLKEYRRPRTEVPTEKEEPDAAVRAKLAAALYGERIRGAFFGPGGALNSTPVCVWFGYEEPGDQAVLIAPFSGAGVPLLRVDLNEEDDAFWDCLLKVGDEVSYPLQFDRTRFIEGVLTGAIPVDDPIVRLSLPRIPAA